MSTFLSSHDLRGYLRKIEAELASGVFVSELTFKTHASAEVIVYPHWQNSEENQAQMFTTARVIAGALADLRVVVWASDMVLPASETKHDGTPWGPNDALDAFYNNTIDKDRITEAIGITQVSADGQHRLDLIPYKRTEFTPKSKAKKPAKVRKRIVFDLDQVGVEPQGQGRHILASFASLLAGGIEDSEQLRHSLQSGHPQTAAKQEREATVRTIAAVQALQGPDGPGWNLMIRPRTDAQDRILAEHHDGGDRPFLAADHYGA